MHATSAAGGGVAVVAGGRDIDASRHLTEESEPEVLEALTFVAIGTRFGTHHNERVLPSVCAA